MDLLYKEEHTNCLNYDIGCRSLIEIHELSTNEIFDGNSLLGKIIFVVEGELDCNFGMFNHFDVPSGCMLYMPTGYEFSFTSKTKARFLVMRLVGQIKFCECYPLESLTQQTKSIQMYRDLTIPIKPFMLPIIKEVEMYLINLQVLIKKGLRCKFYFETKTKEFFYLLRAFYQKEQLAYFFWDALSMDSSFSYFVTNNYLNYRNLAQMAGAMNMSLSGFEKRFKRVFSISAAKWINQEKSKRIYHAICNEKESLKELAMRFGFSSNSTFNDFCKRNLSDTPGGIRKKIRYGRNDEQIGGKE